MSDIQQPVGQHGQKTVVVHPGPASIDELLQHTAPAPDDETERFIAAIYADRHDANPIPSRQ